MNFSLKTQAGTKMKAVKYLIICVFLCGCIAKNVSQNLYLLNFSPSAINCQSQNLKKKAIFIATPKAFAQNETKFIIVKNGEKIRFINDAKFMLFPVQMLKNMIFSAFRASGKFEPTLENREDLLRFDGLILDLYIDEKANSAKFSLSYEIIKNGKILQKATKFSQIKIKSNDIDDIISSLSSAVNLALNEIINDLCSVNLE